jgi:thymidine kinase
VDKIQAICTVCGLPASKTYRKRASENEEQVLIGESDVYEARCRFHWDCKEEEEELLAFSRMIGSPSIKEEAHV